MKEHSELLTTFISFLNEIQN